MSFLDNINWRFATKEFDIDNPISHENLNKILEAIRLAPSSYGLQPFHIYVIKDLKTKQKIKPIADNQNQIDSCSELIIFCSYTDKKAMNNHIDKYAELSGNINHTQLEKIETLKTKLKKSIANKPLANFKTWSAKQCYIALGFGLAACAELQIDSCPMEGFNKKDLNKFLKLPPYLTPVVLLTVGYRVKEPARKKVRLNKNDLFTNI